jgi:hypothetical protein
MLRHDKGYERGRPVKNGGLDSKLVFVFYNTMLTPDQQKTALLAPCLPLSFLVRPERRAKKPTGMESFSESACFHRLHNLFWTLNDAEAVALLSDDEQAALAEFSRVFESLPWLIIEAHPHISELPSDDLSPLVPAGERLLRMLESRTERPRRFAWLRQMVGFFRSNHERAA